MCGIAGLVRFRGASPDREVLEKMTSVLAHRGPDGHGFEHRGAAALGHRRLAILDLSPAGRQPMTNEDGRVWITCNGEIYNYRPLRAQLQSLGHRFRSDCDVEVIVHAYEEWGLDAVRRLDGMFAFALWDERQQRLWLVRDRLGIKPLFYHSGPGGLSFGSEVKAVLADPQVTREVDAEALAYFLALNYVPAPRTLFAEVRQLEPAEMLVATADGSVERSHYWQLDFDEERRWREPEAVEAFDEALRRAVEARLMSDVPFGCFLSGGVDSSAIAYYMSQALEMPVKTFTIGFEEDTFSEIEHARKVSARLETEAFEEVVRADAARLLPTLVWHAEEPTADSSMVAVYQLARLARRHVTMVLAGDGADEILAGYETYPAYYAHRLYRRLVPPWPHRRLAAWAARLPASDAKVPLRMKLQRFLAHAHLTAEEAHATRRLICNAELRRRLLSPIADRPGVDADPVELYRRAFRDCCARHPVNRMLAVDTRLYLPNDMLIKVDRMTMAHGLEARVPFLDHHLVELAARLPARLKLRRWVETKYLLKRTMRGRLPSAILARAKAGFNVPKGTWLRRDLRQLVLEHLSADRVTAMGLLDLPTVEGLLDEHFDRRADHSFEIWGLLTLSLWWYQFVDPGERLP